MKLMVTGCNGQLGRAIYGLAGKEGHEYLGTDVGDLDITKLSEVLAYAEEKRPDVIINCAAATNVDGCEKDEEGAYRINAIGPRNLAIAAEKTGAKLIHISTDYVFPGNAERPYRENDTPAPKSAYGRTKLAGEEYVKQFCRRWFIVRTAWLYGDGKNFVKTMLALSEKMDTIGIVDDQLGNPTSALELARAVMALVPTEEYGVYHGTCEGICSWADFAEQIFKLGGKSAKVERISSQEYKRRFPESADRPAFSAMEKMMFRLSGIYEFKGWQEALEEYFRT